MLILLAHRLTAPRMASALRKFATLVLVTKRKVIATTLNVTSIRLTNQAGIVRSQKTKIAKSRVAKLTHYLMTTSNASVTAPAEFVVFVIKLKGNACKQTKLRIFADVVNANSSRPTNRSLGNVLLLWTVTRRVSNRRTRNHLRRI